MRENFIPLNMSSRDREVRIVAICGGRGVISKLADMGLVIGSKLKVVQGALRGQSLVISGNTKLALGCGMAQKIMVADE